MFNIHPVIKTKNIVINIWNILTFSFRRNNRRYQSAMRCISTEILNLRRSSYENGVSKSSVQVDKKLLRLKPNKFTAVPKLQQLDRVATVRFCNWLWDAVCNGEIEIMLAYLTDEGLF